MSDTVKAAASNPATMRPLSLGAANLRPGGASERPTSRRWFWLATLCLTLVVLASACRAPDEAPTDPVAANLVELEHLAQILESSPDDPEHMLDDLEDYLSESTQRRTAIHQELDALGTKRLQTAEVDYKDRLNAVSHRLTVAHRHLLGSLRHDPALFVRYRTLAGNLIPASLRTSHTTTKPPTKKATKTPTKKATKKTPIMKPSSANPLIERGGAARPKAPTRRRVVLPRPTTSGDGATPGTSAMGQTASPTGTTRSTGAPRPATTTVGSPPADPRPQRNDARDAGEDE